MTLQELPDMYRLRNEEAKLHRRVAELRAESVSLSSPRWDGMPRSSNRASRVERYAVQLAALEEELFKNHLAQVQMELALTRFIASVSDSRARIILSLRFVDCLSWEQIARELGGDATPWQVRRYIYRYLEKGESNIDDTP